MKAIKEQVKTIHQTAPMCVIEFAGVGTQALTWLHSVGGSSRTVLEATDRYSTQSMVDLLGCEPSQYVSAEVAQAMAEKAYQRAQQLAPPDTPVMGVGCTGAIATDRSKKGDHQAYLVVCSPAGFAGYALSMTKGIRTRKQEEKLVSRLLIRLLSEVMGVAQPLPLQLTPSDQLSALYPTPPLLERLLLGELPWLEQNHHGVVRTGEPRSHIALLSGSFNPLHDGHRQMRQAAMKLLNQPVYFELPLVNAEKGHIETPEIRRRMAQFVGYAPLLLTRAPLFSDKAALFPYSAFVVGVDTALRLLEPRFYGNDPTHMATALQQLSHAGCYFLVAGRLVNGQFMTLDDVAVPPAYQPLFKAIPSDMFRLDISSTEIRANLIRPSSQSTL